MCSRRMILTPLILLLAFLSAFAAPLSKKNGAMKTIEVLQRGE